MMVARQPARPLAIVALVFALALVAGVTRRRGAPLLGFAETVRVSVSATTTMTSRGPLVPFNSSNWRLQKMTHLSSLATLNSTLHLFTTYLAGSLTDCPSDLGCSVRRAKFGVRGTHSGALQFLAAPLFDDLGEADGWVTYFRELHGDMRNFDAFMHNKVVLYARDLATYAGPLIADGIPLMLRSSVDADGADVLHLGLQVEGVVFELVGAAGDMPGVDAPAWSADECPAAHALPFTLAYLSDLVGLADDADDDFALYANEPLLAVTLGMTQHGPGVAIRFVDNAAAPSGSRSLADYDAYVRRDHEAFLYEDGAQNPDGWDRYLDQHLGIWYSGGEASCQARASALRVLLADVPSKTAADRADAPAECGCTGDNNEDTWYNLTGDACWAMGDDWCE
ncbi:hypothetical protein JL722_6603 [Aureococcus anophagefferens]|nr:hypothetical protein JL722_6603 [Aureococcus anophagefferens]